MKNLKVYLVISICINILLSYIVLKKEPNYTNTEQYLIDKIKADNAAKKKKLKSDSLHFVNQIKVSEKKINKINDLRKHERYKYQLELSKLQSINNDSAFTYILDSIKKVCCPDHNR